MEGHRIMSASWSRSALATLAMVAAQGSAPGGAVERIVEIGRRSLAAKARKKKGRRRLSIATGPGSISAKAEITRLVLEGRDDDAYVYADDHLHACGENLFRLLPFGGVTETVGQP